MGSKGQTGNTFGHTLSFLTLITSFSNTMMKRVSGTMILLLLLVTFHGISTQGTGGSGDWSFCKGSCTLGQGDCDRDTDCIGNLFCGQNNCRLFHSQAHPWADCCMKPGCTIKDNYVIPAGNNAPGGQGISSNGPKDCNDRCVGNNQCVAWTLQKETNLCWLKTVTNFIGGRNEWISGTKCDDCCQPVVKSFYDVSYSGEYKFLKFFNERPAFIKNGDNTWCLFYIGFWKVDACSRLDTDYTGPGYMCIYNTADCPNNLGNWKGYVTGSGVQNVGTVPCYDGRRIINNPSGNSTQDAAEDRKQFSS